jgi:hypothetical protein
MNTRFLPLLLPLAAFAQSTQPPPLDGRWEKRHVTPYFWAEGATAGDLNKDGHADLVYGPHWYEGPDFTKRHAYADDSKTSKIKKADGTEETIPGFKGALSQENEYSKNFLAFTHDFNGDGWLDILILGFPGEKSSWFENPKGAAEKWTEHLALEVTDNESPHFTDLTGDGRPEIVCSSKGHWGFAEYDPKNPTALWTWRNISPKGAWQRFTHGMGVGDVNGDGRRDILEKDGWWEQPAAWDGTTPWPKHDAQWGGGGAQMFAYDVDGDGKNDIITSLAAHGYGVAWFRQVDDGGVTGWQKNIIVGAKPGEGSTDVIFSQPHAMDLADIDGDGVLDLITGKRFWAHGPKGDADPNAWSVTYWFRLTRAGGKAVWTPHLIDDDAGVGTQVQALDVNGDKKPDVVVGNKRGAFVLLQK